MDETSESTGGGLAGTLTPAAPKKSSTRGALKVHYPNVFGYY